MAPASVLGFETVCSFPHVCVLSCVFGRKLKRSEHWQRTEYPERAEPGLAPNALGRIRGSSHRPSWERVSIAWWPLRKGDAGLMGQPGWLSAGTCLLQGQQTRPLRLVPRGSVQSEMVEHMVPPGDPGGRSRQEEFPRGHMETPVLGAAASQIRHGHVLQWGGG